MMVARKAAQLDVADVDMPYSVLRLTEKWARIIPKHAPPGVGGGVSAYFIIKISTLQIVFCTNSVRYRFVGGAVEL